MNNKNINATRKTPIWRLHGYPLNEQVKEIKEIYKSLSREEKELVDKMIKQNEHNVFPKGLGFRDILQLKYE